MEFDEFRAGENDSGRRLDRILKIMLKGKADVNIFSALRKKLILVNGAKAEASYKVKSGDIIKIASFLIKTGPEDLNTDPKVKEYSLPQENLGLTDAIVFKNESLMVINKPYGINVQPSFASETSLSQLVAREFKKSTSLSFTPAPLHRLDRFTSGALVFSLSIEGARIFSKMMQQGLIRKTYVGIVQGRMEKNYEWKDAMEEENCPESSSFHKVRVVGQDRLHSKDNSAAIAITKASPLEWGAWKGEELTLVRFEIPTGRKHQIRAQSSFHGFPLLGDRAYGGTKNKDHEFYLHAIQIEFPGDNGLKIPEKIQVPLPDDFSNFLNSALINWKGQLII